MPAVSTIRLYKAMDVCLKRAITDGLLMQVSHGSTMFLYNMDFAMEWPRPLPPNVQLVGALLPTQAKPLPPIFEVRT